MEVDEAVVAVLRGMIGRSRSRAIRARMLHSLPDDHAVVLYDQQAGRCDVTGLRFSMQRFPDALVKHPFAPSLDRRDSAGGYTVENVRLVFVSVNFGLGQWGQEVYLHCARAAVEHDRATMMEAAARATAAVGTLVENVPDGSEWLDRQRDRIRAAETIAATLAGDELQRQRRHIASLRRSLTLGPAGLSLAGRRAAEGRKPL